MQEMTSDDQSGRYPKSRLFWAPALVVMGWVTGRNRSIQHKGGNGLGRREKPIDSEQVRAPTLVALECTIDHGQRPAAPQAAEPNASRGSCKS